MQTLEKKGEKSSNREEKYINNHNSRKMKKNKNIKKILINLLGFVLIIFACFSFLFYGPYSGFRDWYITSAMTTMNHQYLAEWIYNQDTINDVLDRNKVVETSGITDTNQISTEETNEKVDMSKLNQYEKEIYEKDKNHPDYKIIDIKEKNYSGYLAVVYNASKIHTLVTAKLGKSGQYMTTMAENNKAILAINGGGFEDPNHNSSGGMPLGITISKGKIVTKSSYTGAGGMIGFDENNKLVLGKVSVDQAKTMKIRDAVTCGPFLILNGKASEIVGNGGWGTAPRTAIGQRKDGIVLMLVVDGRRAGMQGADMDDLIKIMERYGAYNASALDGGTSSVMIENYKIINDPIDSAGKHKTRPIADGFGLILD